MKEAELPHDTPETCTLNAKASLLLAPLSSSSMGAGSMARRVKLLLVSQDPVLEPQAKFWLFYFQSHFLLML